MKRIRPGCLFLLLLLGIIAGCVHADPARRLRNMPAGTGFILRSLTNASGEHKYSVFIPRDYTPDRKYPAIVFLHGIGESGRDGKKCTTVGIGPAIARRNGDFPFIVLFPQNGWDWTTAESDRLVMDILNDAMKYYSIDPDRVSLTGLSSGGLGTWVLGARHPQQWSALVPMGSYPSYDDVPRLTGIPIWALHNSGDPIVPCGGTRQMYQRIRQAGGNIRYTEFEAFGHNCWDKAYDQGELFAWLQRQTRATKGEE